MPSLEFILKILFTALTLFTGTLACFSLILIAHWLLKVRADRQQSIRIENQGNCRSVYQLSLTSTEPLLKFALLNKNTPLMEVAPPVEEEDELIETTFETVSPATQAKPGKEAAAPATATPKNDMSKQGQAVAAKAGTAASVLGILGSLLPGSLGAGFREQATAVRDVQTGTTRAVQAPKTIQRQVGALGKESGKLAGNQPTATPQKTGAKPAQVNQSRPQVSTSVQQMRAASKKKNAERAGYGFQTPELSPGQALTLTLKVGTNGKRYPSGSFAYVIQSQQYLIDFPDVPSEPMVRSGTVHFKSIGTWRYWLAGLASTFIILLTLISLVYASMRIWQ